MEHLKNQPGEIWIFYILIHSAVYLFPGNFILFIENISKEKKNMARPEIY